MTVHKFGIGLVVMTLATSGQAGEISAATRAALGGGKKAISFDLEKAMGGDALRIPMGSSDHLFLELQGISKVPTIIYLRLQPKWLNAAEVVQGIQESAVAEWKLTRGYREPSVSSFIDVDGTTIMTINTLGDARPLARFIIAAAERYNKIILGAQGL